MNPFRHSLNYFAQMKPAKKWVFIGFFSFQIMFIAACLLGLSRADTMISRMQNTNKEHFPPVFRLLDTVQLISQINLQLANYSNFEGNQRKQSKEIQTQCKDQIVTNMKEMSLHLHSDQELKEYQAWDRNFQKFLQALTYYQSLIDQHQVSQAKNYYFSVINPLNTDLVTELQKIIQFHKEHGHQKMLIDFKIGKASRDLLLIFLAFGTFLGISLFISVFKIVENSMSQLELKQKRLDMALDIGKMGTWTVDIKSSNIYLSESLRSLFHLDTKEEVIPLKTLLQHTHPDDRSLLIKYLTKPSDRFSLEFKLVKDDGEFHWIVASGFTAQDNSKDRRPHIIGIVADITEIRKATSELDRFFLISSELLAIATPTGYLKRVNAAFVKMFGYTIDEFEGRSLLQLIKEADHPETICALEKLHEGEVIHLENRCLHKDGSERIIYWTLTRSSEENVVYITARDVTEEREQEQVLLQSAKMLSLGEMSAGIAHEVNNPLAIIKTKAQQIRKSISREQFANLPAYIEEIESTVERIVKIVQGLRSFSRDGQKDPYENALVQVLIEDTLNLCRSRFLSHGVQLETNTIAPDLKLECRPVQISQILLNLLNNAFDAIGEFKEKWVRVEVMDCGDSIEIAVTDSGNGIPKEVINKLFRPFFTTKAIGVGTGLGLSISSSIIKAHQGTLKVDESSKNTRFLVRLPKVQPKKNEALEGAA